MSNKYNIIEEEYSAVRHLTRPRDFPSSSIRSLISRAHESLENTVMWDRMEAAQGDHPVLKKNKIITGFGARRFKGNLVVAFSNIYGEMALLFIPYRGEPYLKGDLNGGVAVLATGKPEYLTVDYLSGASVSQMTFKPCLVAGSGENLIKVARLFRDLTIIVNNDENCTDYDYAMQCNALFGNTVFRIPRVDEGVVNANDLMKAGFNICKYLGIEEHHPKFQFLSNVLKNPMEVRWLIHGLVRGQASVMMLFAPSHSGKTYVALDMMLKIAFGYPDWFGHKIHQGHVLYLCGEGVADVHERVILWLQQYGKTVASLADKAMILQETVELDNDEAVTEMIEDIKIDLYGIVPRLIAIDTMSLFMGGDENNTQDANRLIRNLKRIAMAFDCCVTLIHHTSKSNEEAARGNGAIKAALDSEIMVRGSDGNIEVRQTKNRGMKQCEAIWLELEEHEIMKMIDKDTGKLKTNSILVPGQKDSEPEAQKSQKRSKLDDDKDFLVSACIKYAAVDIATRGITIGRDDLAKEGSAEWDISIGDALKKLNPKQEYKPLWRLLNNGVIEETEPGSYKVTDVEIINRILTDYRHTDNGDEDFPEYES